MKKANKIVLSGIFLAISMLLPFLTGQIPEIGSMLSPMHIPVLICGFVCGWPYGLAIGATAPILRFLIFGMPPLFPVGIAMTFELAAYGYFAGLLYKYLPKKAISVYVSLISSMLIGRAVWGAVMYVLSLIFTVKFSWGIFAAGAFVNAIPGIILHIVLVPIIVIAILKVTSKYNGRI